MTFSNFFSSVVPLAQHGETRAEAEFSYNSSGRSMGTTEDKLARTTRRAGSSVYKSLITRHGKNPLKSSILTVSSENERCVKLRKC